MNNQAQPKKGIIIQKLIEKPLGTIAMIDDAFDFKPENVLDEQIGLFWTDLQNPRSNNYDARIKEFNAFTRKRWNKVINNQNDLDNDIVAGLWENRGKFSFLKDDLSSLFGNEYGKLAVVERIHQRIESEGKDGKKRLIKIKNIGKENTKNTALSDLIGDSKVILLDFYLGNDSNPTQAAQSRRDSVDLAKRIYEEFSKKELPLIILMSSDPDVIKAQDEFQKETGWLKGLFYCVTKDDLEDPNKLKINIVTWIERLEKGMIVHKFAKAVQNSISGVVEQFGKSINNLSLEDYAYVGNFSLQAEGQPLGEYMLWLFNSLLGRLAFEDNNDVKTNQTEVDEISFAHLPLKQLMPSKELIKMYDSALFDKSIGSLQIRRALGIKETRFKGSAQTTGIVDGANIKKSKERGDKNKLKGKSFDLPYLRLGMVFVRDKLSPALMVLNADCDIIFTKDGERFPSSVVALIGGELENTAESMSGWEDYHTEFFQYDEQDSFHIRWNVKDVTFCEYPKLSSFLEKNNYELRALLRTPFVLKVQQAYAAQFSRIGLPVAPPVQHAVTVEFHYKNFDGTREKLFDKEDVAFIVKTRDKKEVRCHLTVQFFYALLTAIDDLKNKYQDKLNQLAGENGSKKLEQRLNGCIEKLDNKLGNLDEWVFKESWYKLGKDVKPIGSGDTILIYRNADEEILRKWTEKQNSLILVNLKISVAEDDKSSDQINKGVGDE